MNIRILCVAFGALLLCGSGSAVAKLSAAPESRLQAPVAEAGIDVSSLTYMSELERAVLKNSAAAFEGARCDELDPLVRIESPDRNRFLVSYLELLCAKNLADRLHYKAKIDRDAEAATVLPGEYFGQTRIRADGLVDAVAYVRAKQRKIISTYLEVRGGGRAIDLVVISRDAQNAPTESWRLDVTAAAQLAIAKSGPGGRVADDRLEISRDLPGLVYSIGASSGDDAPTLGLVGRALFLASLPDRTLADAEIRALLERAAGQKDNDAYAKWLLAKSWLLGDNQFDTEILARAGNLARKSADDELPEGEALVAAMAQLHLGNIDDAAGQRAEEALRSAVGKARAEYLLSDAMHWFDKRNDAKTAFHRWLERAAADGDALAQFQMGEHCHSPEMGQPESCRMPWYLRSAAQGYVTAMRGVGMLYRDGVAAPKDLAKAYEWFNKAVEHGSVDALAELGNFFFNGQGAQKDTSKAVAYYKKGADSGDSWAESNLAVAYRTGQGVTKNLVESLRWSRLAAFQNNLNGLNGWAYALDNGEGAAPDSQKAYQIYAWCALQGGAVCMSNLAALYQAGRGVDKNPRRALYWYERSAQNGNIFAMNKLGWMLFEGSDVPADQAEGEKWLRKSALTGDSEGMRGLGFALLYRHQSPSLKEGMDWLMRSAQVGNALAMNNLAAAYKAGNVVPKDMHLYEQWLLRAGEAGDADSMNSLGWFYEHYEGGAADPGKATAWYKRASDAGSVDGMNNYARQVQAGAGVPKNLAEAKSLFETAAAHGSHHAKCNLGGILASENGAQARSWALLTEAADAGNAICQRVVGLNYHYGGNPEPKADFERAEHYLQLAAAQGDEEAQADLSGVILQTKERDRTAAAAARKTLETLADKGWTRAQVLLGNECIAGRGGAVDLPCARKRFEQAVGNDTSFKTYASLQLGEMSAAGNGGPVDMTAAEKWLRVATTDFSFRGDYDLGTLLVRQGRAAEGLELLDKSATKGNLASAYHVQRYCKENPSCALSKARRDEIDSMLAKIPNRAKNNTAWLLAINPFSDTEDGRFAADLVESMDKESRSDAGVLDTLAACQARSGNFAAAQEAQTQALEKLDPNAPPSSRRQMEDRRKRYASKAPWSGPE